MKVVKWLCRCTSFISSLELKLNFGFRIPIVNEILHSSSKIQDTEAQDFWFHRQKFPIFVNPDYRQREDQSLKCDSQDIDIRRK